MSCLTKRIVRNLSQTAYMSFSGWFFFVILFGVFMSGTSPSYTSVLWCVFVHDVFVHDGVASYDHARDQLRGFPSPALAQGWWQGLPWPAHARGWCHSLPWPAHARCWQNGFPSTASVSGQRHGLPSLSEADGMASNAMLLLEANIIVPPPDPGEPVSVPPGIVRGFCLSGISPLLSTHFHVVFVYFAMLVLVHV